MRKVLINASKLRKLNPYVFEWLWKTCVGDAPDDHRPWLLIYHGSKIHIQLREKMNQPKP
jgi:hypothetical protein